MQNERDEPDEEGDGSAGQGYEHEPAHDPQGIEQLPIILAIYNARMHRTFIDATAVRVCDYSARDHRSYRRERDENNQHQNDPIWNPRKSFPFW